MSEQNAIEEFRKIHRGAVITPGDPRYEEGRRVWNAMIDKRPALIARCRSAVDVITAVQFARANQLLIAIRGGGHNIAGSATCDGGIVIDLSEMKGIRVDPVARTVRAEPGLRWIEFDRETQAFGLATTGGTIGDTGIAGLTLGGGFGWLEGTLGMTVDNLIGADVVLASGELVHASADESGDLYWALRGGGGNFGVVTSFEYQLHPVGPTIVGGLVMHPFSRAFEVLKFYGDFLRGAPDPLTAAAVLLTGPDGQKACAIVAAYEGPVAEGEKAVQPLKQFGPPLLDVIGPIPYVRQQALIDNAMPPNLLNYWKADFISDVSDGLIQTAVDAYSRVPSPISSILFFPIHGAASRVPPDATAYPHRKGIHMGIYSLWNDRTQNQSNVAWVRETWAALQPFVPGGVYVNELGDDEGDDRVRQAFAGNYTRLARIKAKYDPQNVFCINANVKPVGQAERPLSV
jgi:FAD/FMN-containing dehydrogenase